MKRFTVGILALYSLLPLAAQTHWYNPMNDSLPPIEGRYWNRETGSRYHRLPQRAKQSVRPELWELGTHSAGLSVCFHTNATNIQVRYTVRGNRSMPHMPATGVSGMDLYRTDDDGSYRWCKGRWHFGDTIVYTYQALDNRPEGHGFRLYLPLFTEVRSLEIGVADNAEFRFISPSEQRPVVVYGTSIAHGACASRPGMAWVNQVQRRIQNPVVNLGFSGNGLMEKIIFQLMGEIDASVYVIDCLPNLVDGREEWIKTRLQDGIEWLRKQSDAPILLVEHNGYEGQASSSKERIRYEAANRTQKAVYDSLKHHFKGLYYLPTRKLKLSPDNQVDGVHPSDLGMTQYADAYVRALRKLIKR